MFGLLRDVGLVRCCVCEVGKAFDLGGLFLIEWDSGFK